MLESMSPLVPRLLMIDENFSRINPSGRRYINIIHFIQWLKYVNRHLSCIGGFLRWNVIGGIVLDVFGGGARNFELLVDTIPIVFNDFLDVYRFFNLQFPYHLSFQVVPSTPLLFILLPVWNIQSVVSFWINDFLHSTVSIYYIIIEIHVHRHKHT